MSAFTSEGTENRMRWNRSSAPFMEVWYSTLNHRDSGTGLWFRYTLTAPKRGAHYCELWAFAFDPSGRRHFAGKLTYPIDHLGSSDGRDDGARVRIGDAWLSDNHLEGAVDTGGRSLAWSLDFDPADRCFQHLPPRLRRHAERLVSTVCSPNLAVGFGGSVKLDDQVLELEDERGSQSHRWGRKHSSSWAWAHCSDFEGRTDAVFEGVAARASVGGVPAPTATFLYLAYEGIDLVFNDFRSALRARSHYEMPTWAFTARNDRWKIVGAGRAQLGKTVQVAYTDPDLSKRYCANSEIASLAIEVYERSGAAWRHHGSLTAIGTAHLEFGRREPFVELPITL